MNQNYKKIYEPFQLGQMQLKNRIVMAPMGTGYSGQNGSISQRLIGYYEARAKGGAGLIIVEGTAPGERCSSGSQLTLGNDHSIRGWQELTEAVHKHGAKIAVQLMHGGWEIRDGKRVQVSPSPVIVRSRNIGLVGLPHELTIEEIGEMVEWYAAASVRAKAAGFDGMEIHGAHQYIIASFLSSASNLRKDKYGGTIENKARFAIEILQAVRRAVGTAYPVWIRLNAREYDVENGVTIEETKRVVPLLVDAGAQAIHVSAYGAGSYSTKAPLPDTPGFLLPLAAEVKKITTVPVLAVGRLSLEIGEQAVIDGKADLITLGRRLIADPEIPNKTRDGRLDDIQPCIGCMVCIEKMSSTGRGMACSINPVAGKETEYRILPATRKKTVAVVGGGPAGIEAAIVSALKGHKVVLFEKENRLGGVLNVAALPPNKVDIVPWIKYLEQQIKKAGVEIRLGVETTWEDLKEIHADAVVIATGGIPLIPEIPGLNARNAVTAQDVLFGKVKTGQNVVILGGGLVGCETGHYLASRGAKVTIIEVLGRMAGEMGPMVRRRLMDGLREYHANMLVNTKCIEIKPGEVTILTGEGLRSKITADTIVIAVGYKKNDTLLQSLQGKIPELYCIGDAAQPRGIIDATNDGYRTGLSL